MTANVSATMDPEISEEIKQNLTIFIPKFTIRISNRFQAVAITDEVLGGPSVAAVHYTVLLLASLFLLAALINAVVFLAAYLDKGEERGAVVRSLLLSITGSGAVGTFTAFATILSSGFDGHWARRHGWLCQGLGSLHLLLLLSTNLTLALVAVDRCEAVVTPLAYAATWPRARRRSALLLGSVWALAFLLASAPLLGWSRMAYSPVLLLCHLVWPRHPVYVLLVFTVAVLTPAMIMAGAYARVQAALGFQQRCLERRLSLELDSSRGRRLRAKVPWMAQSFVCPKRTRRFAALALGSVALSWTPTLLWAALEMGAGKQGGFALVAFVLLSLSHLSTPLLYGLNHSRTAFCLRKLLGIPSSAEASCHLLDFVPPESHWPGGQLEPVNLLKQPKLLSPPRSPAKPLRRSFPKSPQRKHRVWERVPQASLLTGTNGLPPPVLSAHERRRAETLRLIAAMQPESQIRRSDSEEGSPTPAPGGELRGDVPKHKDPYNLYLHCEEPLPSPLAKARSATHFSVDSTLD